MDLRLAGLTAVVTGGSAGIGAAIVTALVAEGCHVHFCGRDARRIETMLGTVAASPGTAHGKVLDVHDTAGLAAWFADIGAFDIFIPNVSALSINWQDALKTDVQATVDATEAAIAYLKQSRHGAITYIGSKAGSLPAPQSAAYGAVKAAMAHTMKSLSARLLPQVRVNTVSPGDTLFDGGLWDRVRLDDPEGFAKVVARNPLNRLATAQEVANVVAFISSPAASFVAGANWYVDGGSINHVQF